MSRAKEMCELFARWRDSGQSLMAFGKQEGMSYSKLLYWRRKLKDGAGARSRASRKDVPLTLVPVEIIPDRKDEATTPGKFEVWFANGVSLDVATGFDETELRRLVGVLRSC